MTGFIRCKDDEKEKIPKVMRFLVLISLFCFTPISAEDLYPQQKNISLNLQDVTISRAISEIEKKSDYVFMIADDAKAELNTKADIRIEEGTIQQILDILLKDTDLSYKAVERQVSIFKDVKETRGNRGRANEKGLQQNRRRVTGHVTDKNGEPLIGAAIVLGSNPASGTTSDIDGNFSIEIGNDTEMLKVSYIGYQTKEIKVDVNSTDFPLKIVLQETDIQIEEVVVTGIFNKSRESYTGAATTITSKELQEVGNRSLLSSIRNIDPSFNILQDISIGSNPNALPSINIRGVSSLNVDVRDLQDESRNLRNANQPLIILDGFEISMSRFMDLDENQIAAITLLKDNSATSLYGSRGANGVVVISTRKPEPGRLRITYKGNIQFETPDLSSYSLMNSREKLAFEKAAGLYKSINANYEQELLDLYNERKMNAERGVDTDWLKYPVRTGIGNRHSLRLEGGDDIIRYAAGLSYNNIAGAMKGSDRNVFNGNMFLQYNYKNFIFQNDLQVSSSVGYESPYGTFQDFAKINAYWTPYDEDGNIQKMLEDFLYISLNRRNTIYNPLYNALLPQINKNKYQVITNNFSLEWKILPELFLRGRLSVTSRNDRGDRYISAKDTSFDKYTGDDYARKGSYLYTTGNEFSYDADITFNYSKRLASKHQLDLGLGYNVGEDKGETYNIKAEGFTNINMDFLPMAGYYQKGGAPTGSEGINRRVGIVMTGNYTYDNRYYVDVSGRGEGSSRFGSNNRYAPFWSVGAGWNMHHESFLKEHNIIDVARLRLSYGTSGSQNFSSYQALTTYRDFTGISYRNWFGMYLLGLGNSDLGWQTTYQLNIGTELELFQNRVKINLDVYDKLTDNLLSDVNLPSAGGFDTYKANIGQVSNRGVEASLNVFLIRDKSRDLTWSVGGSLAHNKNEIKKISNSLQFLNDQLMEQSNVNPSFLFKEGQSVYTIFAVPSKGIDPSNGKEIFIRKDGTETYIWNAQDKAPVGVSEPKLMGNLNTAVRYKGFNFNAILGYRYGGQMYNSTLVGKVENIYPYNNADKRAYYGRWKQPGDKAFFKSVKDFTTTNATSRFVMDENTLECRTLSLGYEVPVRWMQKKKLPFQFLSVTAFTEDLFHLSSVKLERGLSYPYSKKFSLSFLVRF